MASVTRIRYLFSRRRTLPPAVPRLQTWQRASTPHRHLQECHHHCKLHCLALLFHTLYQVLNIRDPWKVLWMRLNRTWSNYNALWAYCRTYINLMRNRRSCRSVCRLVPSPIVLDGFQMSVPIICWYCPLSEVYMTCTTFWELDYSCLRAVVILTDLIITINYIV
jgi:hypothetical protein